MDEMMKYQGNSEESPIGPLVRPIQVGEGENVIGDKLTQQNNLLQSIKSENNELAVAYQRKEQEMQGIA